MAYVSQNAKSFENQSVGDGQCVAFVRAASLAPQNTTEKRGEQVKTADK